MSLVAVENAKALGRRDAEALGWGERAASPAQASFLVEFRVRTTEFEVDW